MDEQSEALSATQREELAKSLALAEAGAKATADRALAPWWLCLVMGVLAGVGVTLLAIEGAMAYGIALMLAFITVLSTHGLKRRRWVRDRTPLTHGRTYMGWMWLMLLLLGPGQLLMKFEGVGWNVVKMILLSTALTLVYYKANRARVAQSMREGWTDASY